MNKFIAILLLFFLLCTPVLAEDWYYWRTEELLENLYMEQNFVPMYAEGIVLVDNALNIRKRPFLDAEVVGKLYSNDKVFITGECNGYYQINDNRYVNAEYVYITDTYTDETVFTVQNMEHLRIHHLGVIETKAAAEGVTIKSSLWFKGKVPVYAVVDGYAYFPRGKTGIYKLPVEAFTELIPVGDDHEIISAYRTTYNARGEQEDRAHNIALVSTYLEGEVIEPGKTFSFNRTTGPRSRSKGYRLANAYLGEEVIQDYGGGVCQVSSTIYAAVRQCGGFEIVQRRPHSMRVSYLPEFLEATVNWDNVDFKFKNNYDFPVELSVVANVNDGDGVLLVLVSRKD